YLTGNMYYNSNRLGEARGIVIQQPYIDTDVVDFALGVPAGVKIRHEKGSLFGKWILRKAFEDTLPAVVAWQSKRPLEYGSGMNALRGIIESGVSEEEYARVSEDCRVKFISREHYFYYSIYMEEVGFIPGPVEGEYECPGCGTGIKEGRAHCRLCGWVTEWKRS
ncbi:MAG: hypothetical protein JXJ19_04635, partial [Elusimicrobia bacterium]|nr:hypothetical protein [Elusimicrobiota bacterium]